MNENQKIVYDWLVLTSQLEAMSVIDIYSDMDACADFETIKARNRLTEKEKDQAIYQAIIERWEDQQFTESELKEYGLDSDLYEKVEVTDDGTK